MGNVCSRLFANVELCGQLPARITVPATCNSLVGSSNQSIMQAPLQSPGLGGLLGGIAGGMLSKDASNNCEINSEAD
jgi:hypothetical protein